MLQNIRTTYRITCARHFKLQSYAGTKNLPYEDILYRILENYVFRIRKVIPSPPGPVQYQIKGSDWETPHISLSSTEYDRFTDCRKVLRVSFSLFIAMAIDDFFDSQENTLNDSYPLCSYCFSYFLIDNIPTFVFQWGIPQKPITIQIPPD